MHSPSTLLIVAFATLTGLVGCEKSATEIIVTIDTSFSIPCTINRIVVDVTTSSGDTQTESVVVTENSLPGSLTLVASQSPGQLTVTVTGFLDDLVVATAEERAVVFDDEVSKELRFLLNSECTAGACGAVSQGEFNELPAAAQRITCGEERYTSRDSLELLINACAGSPVGTVMAPGDDEIEIATPLDPVIPFPFFFYGKPVSNMFVGDNGYVAFSTAEPMALNADIGDPRSLGADGGFPAPGALPFWDKLRVGQRVCFAVQGSEPNRLLWVTWDRACFGPAACGSPDQGALTFSVGLEETTNSLHFGYHSMTASGANSERADGLSAVIGITSGVAPRCTADLCGDDGLCPNGDACGYAEFSALSTSLDPIPQVEFRPVTPN